MGSINSYSLCCRNDNRLIGEEIHLVKENTSSNHLYTNNLNINEYSTELNDFISNTVNRYKNNCS